jgi:hypothetical protein
MSSPEDHGHGKILGGGMVGTHAGDMFGEITLSIKMGADAVDIGKTIHPHPTLGESIGMAAEIAAMRMSLRALRPSRTGIWQRKRHPTLRSISASTCDRAKR